jgi:hypothetical protein
VSSICDAVANLICDAVANLICDTVVDLIRDTVVDLIRGTASTWLEYFINLAGSNSVAKFCLPGLVLAD